MHRYQILIEYVGTNFVGWQIQSKGKSIQKFIQSKLSQLLKEKILIIGSGRTDSGVHAIEQSAHFECTKEIQSLAKFLKSINHFVNDMNVSIINIKKGEEITADYGFGYDEDYKQFPCKCSSKNCCGYIVRSESRWRINKKFSIRRQQPNK